jgi:protein-tyrosine phosphatase
MDSPAPLIDLHTHLLPGVDDGAAGTDEAIAMAQLAQAEGIGTLVATPHALRWPGTLGPAAVARRVADLQALSAAAGVHVQLLAGAEMVLIAALPAQIDAGQAVPLNGSRYLLVECPYGVFPPHWPDLMEQVLSRGYIPILAHPERYPELPQQMRALSTLVEQGMLTQVTGGSLLGAYGRGAQRAARVLLRAGLVHVLASDAHDAADRAPLLRKPLAEAARLVGEERARALASANPAAILADLPIPFPWN